MSKKRKKTGKGRKPRPTFDPMASFMPIPPEKVRADMDRNLSALDALATANGATDTQWIELSDCVNTVNMLIEMGEVDGQHADTTQEAIEAMVACADRHRVGDQLFRMTPTEVGAMRAVLSLYHVCLERKAWMVIYRAQKACTERIDKQLGEARQKDPQ